MVHEDLRLCTHVCVYVGVHTRMPAEGNWI